MAKQIDIALFDYIRSDTRLFECCLTKPDAFSTFEGVGDVASVEVEAEFAVVVGEVGSVDVLRHPRNVRVGHDEGPDKLEALAVVGLEQHDRGVALAVFEVNAVLNADEAVLELIDLQTPCAKIEIVHAFVGRDDGRRAGGVVFVDVFAKRIR